MRDVRDGVSMDPATPSSGGHSPQAHMYLQSLIPAPGHHAAVVWGFDPVDGLNRSIMLSTGQKSGDSSITYNSSSCGNPKELTCSDPGLHSTLTKPKGTDPRA